MNEHTKKQYDTEMELPFSIPEPKKEVSLDNLIPELPMILDTAVSYLLADFDYDSNKDSQTALAIRIIAIASDRLKRGLVKKRELAH